MMYSAGKNVRLLSRLLEWNRVALCERRTDFTKYLLPLHIHVPFLFENGLYKLKSDFPVFNGIHENFFMLGCDVQNERFHTSAQIGKQIIDRTKVPELNENDLKEDFVRGGGPGGQSVNKTASAVVLTHIPTGIVIKNQETRSLERNRKLAREILINKLDNLINRDQSIEAQLKRINERKKMKAKQKAKKKQDLKKRWKESESDP
ncbi:mitochondrial translation release factor in rescue isoform X2 [Oratosquilla oratoria]